MERKFRSYGGSTHGSTTFDTTSYNAIVNQEHWFEAADLWTDALFFSSIDPKEFTKERDVVLRELKLREDDPMREAFETLFAESYRLHPYRYPIIGHAALMQGLTAEDVKAYHRSRYQPNAMVIAVVGDIETEAVIKRFTDLTANIPRGRAVAAALPTEPLPVSAREVTREVEAQLGVVTIGFPGVAVDHPDLYALDLLAWVLGAGRGSQLDQALKETGIVHSVSTWNYTPKDPGQFIVTMRMDPERIPEAVDAVFGELAKAQIQLFDRGEVEAAKRVLLREYLADRQTVSGQAGDLALYESLVGDPTFATRYLKGVEGVSLKDLREMAKRYLKPERATTVKLYPKGTSQPLSAENSQQGGEAETEKRQLSNGIRVLLRPEHRLPLVTVNVAMLGGVRYESDQTNGISALTARMLLRGTRNRTAEEITQAVKQMGAGVYPFSGRNTLGVSLEVMQEAMPEALQLLGELLRDSTFPREELEKERRLSLAALKAKEENPFSWGIRRVQELLFTAHPYRLDSSGNADALVGLQPVHLIQFHQAVLNPASIVVTVVGDFEADEVMGFLEGALGVISPQSKQVLDLPEELALEHLRQRQEITPRAEGLVMVGFHGLRVGDDQAPAMDLIDTMLSGAAGRLFTEVREKRGLAYTVGTILIHGVDPGSFILYAVVDPAHLESVQTALLDEMRTLGTTPVPKEELEIAKEGLLGARRIGRQSQGAVASQLSLDELYGLGFDYEEQYEAQLGQVGATDIQELAQELLNPTRCAIVIGLPKAEAAATAER